MLLDRTQCYLQRIEKAPTLEQIVQELLAVAGDFGVEHILAGIVPTKPVTAREFRQSILLERWPAEWGQRYTLRNYVGQDPVIQVLPTRTNAFRWEECDGVGASRVMLEARDFGLCAGIAIPFLTLEGETAAVSLGAARLEISSDEQAMLALVSCFALGRALRIGSAQASDRAPVLSPRERECLQWVAAGKSDWDIGMILGISASTVEKHLLAARRKLGAMNRAQAVAESFRRQVAGE
jgi:LuxR family transcriptional regulator, quorum-sensing system regulator BjaR1